MRILLVNYEYPPVGGGAGNATRFLARALLRLGHEPAVLAAGFGARVGDSAEDGFPVHRLRAWRPAPDRSGLREQASFLLRAACRLRGVVRVHRPEAAIVFFALPCGPLGLLLKRIWGVPYVVSQRGGDVPGLVPGLDRRHRLLRPLRRMVLRGARAVVANAEGLAGLSRKADPVPVLVIPNGVDTEVFRPADGPGPSGPPRILFTGRFTDQKNLPFLLDCCARLREHPALGFEVHLVGDGPARPAVEARARGLGLGDRLRVHGWTSKEAILRHYQEAALFVNPSHYEGMPNTVLEAMACGLPVVASAIPGNADLVEDGRTGLLYRPGDGPGCAAALGRLLEDPALRRSCGESGRALVRESFSWEATAGAYLALLRGRPGQPGEGPPAQACRPAPPPPALRAHGHDERGGAGCR